MRCCCRSGSGCSSIGVERRSCPWGYSFVGVWRCCPGVCWLVGVGRCRCEDCVLVGRWFCCRSVCWIIGVGWGFRGGCLRADWGFYCRGVCSSTDVKRSCRWDSLAATVGLVRFCRWDSSMAGAGGFCHGILLMGVGVTSKAWWLGSMRLLWKVASSCRGGFLLGRWYKNGIGAGFIPVNKKCLRPLAGSFCQQTHVDVAEHEVKSRYINGTLDEKHE